MKRLVITVHGIRTFGQWQERLGHLLQTQSGEVAVEHYHYGYFSALAFLIPPFRWLATRRFRVELLRIIESYPDHSVAIVAHSFGTHLVAWGLRGIPRPKRPRIATLVFAGSVLRSGFPWGELLENDGLGQVINDCGIDDSVLILSQVFVLMTGMAGRVGFTGMTGRRLVNRFFGGGHSHYFQEQGEPSDAFMTRHWVEPLALGQPPMPRDDRTVRGAIQGAALTLMQLADPIKFAAYAALIGVMLYFGYLRPNAEADRQRHQARIESLGRRGRLAISLLDSPTSIPSAVAALSTAFSEDADGTYPEFRVALAHWLPRLRSLRTALQEFPDTLLFSWRGRTFLKTPRRIVELPERVDYFAVAPDGRVFTVNSDAVLSVYQMPTNATDALTKLLTVNWTDVDDPVHSKEFRRHVFASWEPLNDIEFYYFAESQRLVMTGRRIASSRILEDYIEVGVDIRGLDPNTSLLAESWKADDACQDYLGDLAQNRSIPDGSSEDERRAAMQTLCARYRLGEPIDGGHGATSRQANTPYRLRFPMLRDESEFWAVADHATLAEQSELPELSNGTATASGSIRDRTYTLSRTDGKRLVFEIGYGVRLGGLLVCVPDTRGGCTSSVDGTIPNGVVYGSGTGFHVAVAPNLSYALVVRDKYHGESDWSSKDVVLVSFDGGPPLDFAETPDTVDGAAFDTASGQLAMLGDEQLWLFETGSRRLLWRRALDGSREATNSGDLFAFKTPLLATRQFVITQSSSGTVSAYTKSGDPAWISVDLGFADRTPVRFAVSADQAYLLAYNARELRVLLTRTGTVLTSRIEIEHVAKAHRRPLLEPKAAERQIIRAEIDDHGSIHVYTKELVFTRSGPITDDDLKRLLPMLDNYTGLSSSDGKTPLASIEGLVEGAWVRVTPPRHDAELEAQRDEAHSRGGRSPAAQRTGASSRNTNDAASQTRWPPERILVLDPGHGGENDKGGVGPEGTLEKQITLDIARRLGDMVTKAGLYKVLFTRMTDSAVPLLERAEIANRAGATLFLSIHLDSSHNHAASGPLTFYPPYFEDSVRSPSFGRRVNRADTSVSVAGLLERELNQLYLSEFGHSGKESSRAMPAMVLIGSKAPAVLIDVGFITGPEGKRLTEAGFQARIAEAICRVLAGEAK